MKKPTKWGIMCFVIAFSLFVGTLAGLVDGRTRALADDSTPSPPRALITSTPRETSGGENTDPPLSALEVVEVLNEWHEIEARENQSAASTVRYYITPEERAEIEAIIASEAGWVSYNTQALIAECILNGCEYEELRPLELLPKYGYYITHNVEPDDSVKQAVADVFDRGILPTPEKIVAYYAPKYADSPFHESLTFICESDGCRFFKY